MNLTPKKDKILKEIFDQYFPHLVIFATQIVKERCIAEDIVQEVLLNLWEKDKLEKKSVHFFYTCVKNASLNVLKSKEHRIVSKTDYFLYDKADDFSFEDESERMKELELLYQVIEELPDQCKLILKKVYLNNQKYSEVAEELNVSVNTIKTHMFRAMKILRGKFSTKTLLYFSTFFRMLG